MGVRSDRHGGARLRLPSNLIRKGLGVEEA